MNPDLKGQIQDYLNQIKRKVPYDYPNKRQILHMVKSNLYAYAEEHPDADFKDLTEEFGTASEVADSFIKDLSGTDIHKSLAKKKRKKHLLLILFVLLLISLILLVRHLYNLWGESEIIIEETISIYDTELDIDDIE